MVGSEGGGGAWGGSGGGGEWGRGGVGEVGRGERDSETGKFTPPISSNINIRYIICC